MKGKTGMQALSVLLAVMLASAVLVSVVSADVKKCVVGDVVDEATLIERSSSLIREYRTNADAEKAIAAEIQKLPRVSYLAGWSEDDAERVKHVYAQAKEFEEQKIGDRSLTQKDGRMWIDEYNYRGINGFVHPGGMEVSSSGTNCQYLTSHLGQPIGGNPCWIEVGVAKFSEVFGGDPDEFVTQVCHFPQIHEIVEEENLTVPGIRKNISRNLLNLGLNLTRHYYSENRTLIFPQK